MGGPSDLEHDVEQLRLWAAGNPLIVRLWLYGSRARGDHRDDSDLDIAVENLTAPTDTDPLPRSAGHEDCLAPIMLHGSVAEGPLAL
jgi:predicted nucleotidyltransferase